MVITRRQFLKYCSIAAGALGLTSADLLKLKQSMANETGTELPIVWLHGASCSGDSTSLLNTIFYMDGVQLLVTDNVDLDFHQTIQNASGTDIAELGGNYVGAANVLDSAKVHLPGYLGNIAEWSTETWRDGYESIKLRVLDRSDSDKWADAKIYPCNTLLINEFDFCIKFKTSESQAPYIQLELENQDTEATATVSSQYPVDMVVSEPFELDEIIGPTDWNQVCLRNFPLWKAGDNPPGERFDKVLVDLDPSPTTPGTEYDELISIGGTSQAIWKSWEQIKDQYGTWKVTSVKIMNRGDTAVWDGGSASCTMYIDEIRVGQCTYADEDAGISLETHPAVSLNPFLLCIEGSILTAKPAGATEAGLFCEVGPMADNTTETMLHAFLEYAKEAAAVLAIGTCASYGGIPAATGSVTGAKGCSAVLKSYGIKTPVINIPGCPAHPDWIVGTIAQVLAKGLAGVSLDSQGRPKDYYPHYVCNGNMDTQCPWLRNYGPDGHKGGGDDGDSMGLAKFKWGSANVAKYGFDKTTGTAFTSGANVMFEGCLGVLGCRGRKTKADCAYRKWNANTQLTPGTLGVNWCVGSRGGCQGCTDPKFPSNSRFYTFI